MKFFSEHDREGLTAAEEREPRTPLPVRMVASEEYLPITQAAKQRESEQPLYAIADEIAPELGMSRLPDLGGDGGRFPGAQPGSWPVVLGRRC